jgi:pyridoxine kinase
MPPILAISSTVAVGHVGLSAILPSLHLAGLTAAALPTIVLSNHPGFARAAGTRISPESLTEMIDAIERNGWFGDIQTILTGYLPSAAHVAVASAAVGRIREANPSAHYVCDPILGDDPKGVYIDEPAAIALRDQLVPAADIIIPNRFELAWLTGKSVTSPEQAIAAARMLPVRRTIAKSIPLDAGHICNIDIRTTSASSVAIPIEPGVPNGTGDMLSALVAAGWPLPRATAALQAVIRASHDKQHLAIAASAERWLTAAPLPMTAHQ